MAKAWRLLLSNRRRAASHRWDDGWFALMQRIRRGDVSLDVRRRCLCLCVCVCVLIFFLVVYFFYFSSLIFFSLLKAMDSLKSLFSRSHYNTKKHTRVDPPHLHSHAHTKHLTHFTSRTHTHTHTHTDTHTHTLHSPHTLSLSHALTHTYTHTHTHTIHRLLAQHIHRESPPKSKRHFTIVS